MRALFLGTMYAAYLPKCLASCTLLTSPSAMRTQGCVWPPPPLPTTNHPHHRPSPPGRASGTLLPLPLTLTLSLSLLTLTLTLTLTRLCRPRVGRVFVEIGLTFTLFEQAPLPPATYSQLTVGTCT